MSAATVTRADYLAGRVTHEAYYRAVNATAGVSYANVDDKFMARVRQALASGDEHLNTIPLGEWDARAANPVLRANLARALKAHGDGLTMAGAVCCLKQAARDAVARRRLNGTPRAQLNARQRAR